MRANKLHQRTFAIFYLVNFLRKVVYRAYYKRYGPKELPEQIIVLSHMRAGSSLLSKILCTSSEVIGYGETHMVYKCDEDREAALGKILYVLNEKEPSLKTKFFLDKLLHNYLVPPDKMDLLDSDRVRVIILVRDPKEAMRSTIKLLGWNEETVYDYYFERLNYLINSGKFLLKKKKNFLFLTYRMLVEDTDNTLENLKGFLNLSKELTEEYEVKTLKGGDPSEYLVSGKIIRNKAQNYSDVFLSEMMVQHAEKVFAEATNSFS